MLCCIYNAGNPEKGGELNDRYYYFSDLDHYFRQQEIIRLSYFEYMLCMQWVVLPLLSDDLYFAIL